MSKTSKLLIATAVAAFVLPTGAMAAAVNASSAGLFSNLGSVSGNACDNSGTHQDCDIFNSTTYTTGNAVSSGTIVAWGSKDDNNFTTPSTLKAIALPAIGPISGATSNVKIAELTWFNSSTDSDHTPGVFSVDYKLTLTFTSGGSGSPAQTFVLDIDSTPNPTGDRIGAFTLPELTTLTNSINAVLSNWTVSGLQYVTDGASFMGNSTCGNSGTKATWCNPEGDTSDLFIEANFTPTVTGVPEPMTLSLFGAGLAGAAAMRLRRRKKA
jgi:hypothetical protein